MSLTRRLCFTLSALLVATALWLPAVRAIFPSDPDAPRPGAPYSPRASALLERQLALWQRPAARARLLGHMRATNPEWDFMGRTYLVMAFANVALADPERAPSYLVAMDSVIEETLRLERQHGPEHFLLPYWRRAPFRGPSGRSLFVDGEIAMMLAARQLVAREERWSVPLARRVESLRAQLEAGPVLSAESYPNECWTFCNTFALAALRAADAATGSDYAPLARRWVATARERLTDSATGMLVSSYTWDGHHLDGPEGSSIFMVAHSLLLVDEAFAREQFALGREHLSEELLGFGWAREWPRTWEGQEDVDSGPIVPLLEVSAGASGLAVLGAAAFDDGEMLNALLRTLDFAAFPTRDEHGLRYAAGNQVGDAVLLYSLTFGPLWDRVRQWEAS